MINNPTTEGVCPWCGSTFDAKTVGTHRKRFCSSACKNAYHAALRKWAQWAVDHGEATVARPEGPIAVVHDARTPPVGTGGPPLPLSLSANGRGILRLDAHPAQEVDVLGRDRRQEGRRFHRFQPSVENLLDQEM